MIRQNKKFIKLFSPTWIKIFDNSLIGQLSIPMLIISFFISRVIIYIFPQYSTEKDIILFISTLLLYILVSYIVNCETTIIRKDSEIKRLNEKNKKGNIL